MKRTIGAGFLFDHPLDLSTCPREVHALIVLVRIVALLVTIVAAWVIARVMCALPWPADALLAPLLAGVWCRWLERRDNSW